MVCFAGRPSHAGPDDLPPGAGARLIQRLSEAAAGAAGRPTVLVVGDAASGGAAEIVALPAHVVVIAAGDRAAQEAEEAGRLFLTLEPGGGQSAAQALYAAARHSASLLASARAAAELARLGDEVRELTRIGTALMSERDPDRLLAMILEQARRLTVSDAGTLYLVEDSDGLAPVLQSRVAQNDSLPDVETPQIALPISEKSIAGYAASTGKPLIIADAYAIPAEAPYSFAGAFDAKHGYWSKSMLVAPMVDRQDKVVGVLQLINRKRDASDVIRDRASAEGSALPYSQHDAEIVFALAGQAAVSIENTRLYRSIENLFEGFIRAAVLAIEQRDPSTSGHSLRVAAMSCDIASAVDGAQGGALADIRFSREQIRELRYAAMLHDFGKVSVREEVLTKPKKLPELLRERVERRFDVILAALETEHHRRRADCALRDDPEGAGATLADLERAFERERALLLKMRDFVRETNEPALLPQEAAEELRVIAARTFRAPGGGDQPFLTPDEVRFLSIPRGSLDPEERREIESHVTNTYLFLRQIPWTRDLAAVADIAHAHHEKLDGTGYPRGVTADQIPVQARIMTVADIFDALTAADRPYKKAVPTEKALDILRMEADKGQLDKSLVGLFIDAKIYRNVLGADWRDL